MLDSCVQVPSHLRCDWEGDLSPWALVSPLWKKEVNQNVRSDTHLSSGLRLFLYPAVGRLGMAFPLGVFEYKHASSRQQ